MLLPYCLQLSGTTNIMNGQQVYHELSSSQNDCFVEISRDLNSNCYNFISTNDDSYQQLIALQLTNCYRKQANMIPLNCDVLRRGDARPSKQSIKKCIKTLGTDGSGSLLQLFVSQMDRVLDVCYFLQLQNMQKKQMALQHNLTDVGSKVLGHMADLDHMSQKQLSRLRKTETILGALLKDTVHYNQLNGQQISQIAVTLQRLLDISNVSLDSFAKTINSMDLANREQLGNLNKILSILVEISQAAQQSQIDSQQMM